MKRTLIIVLILALLVLVLAVPAFAYPADWSGGKAYGKGIKYHCGASYGQLVKQSPHEFPPIGAKKFANPEILFAHCPLDA
jgi:hypothetical protein